MLFLILSILLVGASIVLTYMSKWLAVVAALAALVLASIGNIISLSVGGFGIIFWIGASLIALGICLLIPSEIRNSLAGQPFFATGALVGMILGLLLNTIAGIILGSAIGIALGALAFGRMQQGKEMGFPSKKFFNYVLAKGFPILVTYSMIGIIIAQLIIS